MSLEVYNATADYFIHAAGDDFSKYLLFVKWKIVANGGLE